MTKCVIQTNSSELFWSVVHIFIEDATLIQRWDPADLIFIKRLQALQSASLLLRDQPEEEIIHIQAHTLLPALETKTPYI